MPLHPLFFWFFTLLLQSLSRSPFLLFDDAFCGKRLDLLRRQARVDLAIQENFIGDYRGRAERPEGRAEEIERLLNLDGLDVGRLLEELGLVDFELNAMR